MSAFVIQHRTTFALALSIFLGISTTHANSPVSEQFNLNLILRQLDTIDRIIRLSESLPVEDGNRYSFDYPRFTAEIELIRQGIEAYQSPARAQPRHPPELTGHYLRKADRKP